MGNVVFRFHFETYGMYIAAIAILETSVEKNSLMDISNRGLSSAPSEEYGEVSGLNANGDESTISIIVAGASGDLAKMKIFPALFALFYKDCLPKVYSS